MQTYKRPQNPKEAFELALRVTLQRIIRKALKEVVKQPDFDDVFGGNKEIADKCRKAIFEMPVDVEYEIVD